MTKTLVRGFLRLLLAFAVVLFCVYADHAYGQACVTNSQVTLTGNLRMANGIPSVNSAIALKPSQQGYIAGCGVNLPQAVTCGTSTDGSVIGTANPLTATIVTASGGGSLTSGTYYVVYTWLDAASHETLASPETVAILGSTGSLVVNPPAAGVPATAVSMNVYISTSTGTETLQGSVTPATNAYTQSTALITGANPPSSNATLCQVTANDAVWPVGTGYVVTMTDTNGNQIPGYPMQWQLIGPGTTINLSNGLPYYHGVVYYPIPLLLNPTNHGTQTITGNINMGGYNITNVGTLQVNNAINLGTGCPANGTGFSANVLNGIYNADCFSGSDYGAKILAAYTACTPNPLTGCTIGTTPGNKTVTTPVQFMTKGKGAILQCSMGTILNWTPTSGTMFQFATAGGAGSVFSTGIRGCTLTGPSTGTSLAIDLGVSASDSTGRTCQGCTVTDNYISGFNVQLNFDSQTWNNHIERNTFADATTSLVTFPSTGVNSGENLSFIDDTFDTTSSTWLLNALKFDNLSGISNFLDCNFDNVQFTLTGGLVNMTQTWWESPNSARTGPYINQSSGVLNMYSFNGTDNNVGGAPYNFVSTTGTFNMFSGEFLGQVPSGGRAYIKYGPNGHGTIWGDIGFAGAPLLDLSTANNAIFDWSLADAKLYRKSVDFWNVPGDTGQHWIDLISNNIGGTLNTTFFEHDTAANGNTFLLCQQSNATFFCPMQIDPTGGHMGLHGVPDNTVNQHLYGTTIIDNLQTGSITPTFPIIGPSGGTLFAQGAAGFGIGVSGGSGAAADFGVENIAHTMNLFLVLEPGATSVITQALNGSTSVTGSNACAVVGSAASSYNATSRCFGYVSSGSTSNSVGLGLYNHDNLFMVFGTGQASINSFAAATANSVCYNASGPATAPNIFATCTSLRKYKDDIQDLEPYKGFQTILDELNVLNPVSYTSKTDGNREIGFIAEDVEAVDPRVSTYDKDGKLTGVEYGHITALLTKVVQDQQKEIEQDRKDIEQLKKQVLDLLTRIPGSGVTFATSVQQ